MQIKTNLGEYFKHQIDKLYDKVQNDDILE